MPTPVSMRRWLRILVLTLLASQALPAVAQPGKPASMPQILTLRDQVALQNRWLAARFESILPEVMRREPIDMWVVICREHNEDPIDTTLVPAPSLFAWRLTMLAFFDRGAAGIERLIVNPYGSGWRQSSRPATRGRSRWTSRRRSRSRTGSPPRTRRC